MQIHYICKFTIPITKYRKMYIFLIRMIRINILQILIFFFSDFANYIKLCKVRVYDNFFFTNILALFNLK